MFDFDGLKADYLSQLSTDKPSYPVDFSALRSQYALEDIDILIYQSISGNPQLPYTFIFQVLLAYLLEPAGRALDITALISQTLRPFKNTNFLFSHPYSKPSYFLSPGWISAMTQGQALSLLARSIHTTDDPDFWMAAIHSIYISMTSTTAELLTAGPLPNTLWLQEYPSSTPSYVLNGNIFALFGLIDLYFFVPGYMSSELHSLINHLLYSLEQSFHLYDSFGWSKYCLLKRNYSPCLYHYLHCVQLSSMASMFRMCSASYYSSRWLRSFHSYPRYLVGAARVCTQVFNGIRFSVLT